MQAGLSDESVRGKKATEKVGKASKDKKRRRLKRRKRNKSSSKKDTSSKISLASLEVVNTHPDNAKDDKDNPMEFTKN